MLIALVLIAAAVIGGVAVFNRWRAEQEWRDKRLPSPLLFAPGDPQRPRPTPTTPPDARAPVGTSAYELPVARVVEPAADGSPLAERPFARLSPFADLPPSSPSVSDQTVQLLPGRLEVIAGDARHREIRFFRVPGQPAELILGREPGDTAQHVTLASTTVSRRHARFAFLDGRWTVTNLSRTNPIVINGAELPSNDTAYDLRDGDRLELGEVVLRFTSNHSSP